MVSDSIPGDAKSKLFLAGWTDIFLLIVLWIIILIVSGGVLTTSIVFILSYIHTIHIIVAVLCALGRNLSNKGWIWTVTILGIGLFIIDVAILFTRLCIIYYEISLDALNPNNVILLFFDVLFVLTAVIYTTAWSWTKSRWNAVFGEAKTRLFWVGWFDFFLIFLLIIIIFLLAGASGISLLTYLYFVHVLAAALAISSRFVPSRPIIYILTVLGVLLVLLSLANLIIRGIDLYNQIINVSVNINDVFLLLMDLLFLFTSFVYAVSFTTLTDAPNDYQELDQAGDESETWELGSNYGKSPAPYEQNYAKFFSKLKQHRHQYQL